MNKIGKIILTMGTLVIIIVTIATFWKSDIIYWFTHTFDEKKYQVISPNEYYLQDNFIYVNNYTNTYISNNN